MFEEAVMRGFSTKAVKFEELCEEWFEEYAKFNLRSTTYAWLKRFCEREELPFHALHSFRHRNNTKTRLS